MRTKLKDVKGYVCDKCLSLMNGKNTVEIFIGGELIEIKPQFFANRCGEEYHAIVCEIGNMRVFLCELEDINNRRSKTNTRGKSYIKEETRDISEKEDEIEKERARREEDAQQKELEQNGGVL